MDDQQEASNAGFVVAFDVLALPATVATSRSLSPMGASLCCSARKASERPLYSSVTEPSNAKHTVAVAPRMR